MLDFISLELLVLVLLFFIGASLLLYITLGGADYGAGILELLPAGPFREKQKHLINYAMGPVWEANHMWLIIIVVILFMGFPLAFNTLMVALHLPMVALLVGIVVRGSVFTFRHYDAIQEPKTQKIYTLLFGLSSLWTSIWLGIIAASLFRGKIDPGSINFVEAYIDPWWGFFPLCVGLFVAAIFTFLASVYLVGETDESAFKKFYLRRAFILNIVVVVLGALVFIASSLEGGDLLRAFLQSPLAILCMIFATAFFGLLWLVIRRNQTYLTRMVAAGQVTLILMGWFNLHAPNAMLLKSGPFSFFEAAAPRATLIQLNFALLVGSVFIFPSLFYLLKVFKQEGDRKGK